MTFRWVASGRADRTGWCIVNRTERGDGEREREEDERERDTGQFSTIGQR